MDINLWMGNLVLFLCLHTSNALFIRRDTKQQIYAIPDTFWISHTRIGVSPLSKMPFLWMQTLELFLLLSDEGGLEFCLWEDKKEVDLAESSGKAINGRSGKREKNTLEQYFVGCHVV